MPPPRELGIILWGITSRFYRENICLGGYDFVLKYMKKGQG
jgi:hypothetical protein